MKGSYKNILRVQPNLRQSTYSQPNLNQQIICVSKQFKQSLEQQLRKTQKMLETPLPPLIENIKINFSPMQADSFQFSSRKVDKLRGKSKNKIQERETHIDYKLQQEVNTLFLSDFTNDILNEQSNSTNEDQILQTKRQILSNLIGVEFEGQ